MNQPTSDTSLSTAPDSSSAPQSILNTGMYMDHLPCPKDAWVPSLGHAPAQFYGPSGVPPNLTHAGAPPYAPVAPGPGVGPGVVHNSFQAGQIVYHPSAVVDVSRVIYLSPYPQPTLAGPPPQYPYAPPISHQAYLPQHHGAGPATGSAPSFWPQAPSLSVGQKHVAEDLEDRHVKRIKMRSSAINNDPCFKPVIDNHGQHNGTFVCSKDGAVIRPSSYLNHIKTVTHLGYKLKLFKCPFCLRTYTRRDACKRHLGDGCSELAAEGALPVRLPTPAFTFITVTSTPNSSPPESMVTEAASDAPNPDFWVIEDPALVAPVLPPSHSPDAMMTEVASDAQAGGIEGPALVAPVLPPSHSPDAVMAEAASDAQADGIEDPALVAPVLPPSQPREITLAEAGGDLDFWRWINDIEDFVDPVPPISEPPSAPLTETMLTEASGDPDFWTFINEIEDFVDPELPLCESPADAAEDPDFCNFPMRTLLICSWLNNSYETTLHQRTPLN
ncbi:hypothetical protein EDB19DRAFT_1900539 [Suillus lakei]|nr:hypothetical protein EDB19DRAFT_1900539 [Suillus lakei]